MTAPPEDSPKKVRVDRWLWAARVYRQRSLATQACTAGHVKLNGGSAKPGRALRVGDRVEARTAGGLKVLEVKALSVKRGSATVARTLFEDHSPPPPPKEERPLIPSAPIVERGRGRPTKRDRRRLNKKRERDWWE